jgi:Rieske Fe-S protein
VALLLATVGCSSEPQCADLGPVVDYPENTVTRTPCIDGFVVNDGGDLQVFLANPMHLEGEGLSWEPNGDEEVTDWTSPVPGQPLPLTGTFWSPAHGERFAIDGSVMGGPAAGPLWSCPIETRDGELWISAREGANAATITALCMSSSSPLPS